MRVYVETMRPDQVAAMTLDEVVEATRQHAIEVLLVAHSPSTGAAQLVALGVTSTLLLGRSTALLMRLRALSNARQTAQEGGH